MGLLSSIFQGIKEAREQNYYPRKLEELKKTNRLFDVDELMDILEHKKSKEYYNAILDHLYRFDAPERGQFGYYKEIENKIIDRMW